LVVLIVCLVLSGLFMGFAVYYTKHLSPEAKRKNGLKPTANQQPEEKKQKSLIKGLWEIEDVRHGVIKLTGGRYRMIASMGNLEFYLLSEEEQHALENMLMQACLSFQFPVQFFSTTEIVNTKSVVDEIRKVQNEEANDVLRGYAGKLARHLENMMEKKEMYVRKSYVVVCADGMYNDEEARNELFRRMMTVQNALFRARIPCTILKSEEIIDLLHRELNRESPILPSNVANAGGLGMYSTGLGVLGEVEFEEEKSYAG